MKVQFDATFDDFLDANRRAIARSRKSLLWQLINALATGLIAGALLYVLIPDFPDKLIWAQSD
jgi:hypothetical protein